MVRFQAIDRRDHGRFTVGGPGLGCMGIAVGRRRVLRGGVPALECDSGKGGNNRSSCSVPRRWQ